MKKTKFIFVTILFLVVTMSYSQKLNVLSKSDAPTSINNWSSKLYKVEFKKKGASTWTEVFVHWDKNTKPKYASDENGNHFTPFGYQFNNGSNYIDIRVTLKRGTVSSGSWKASPNRNVINEKRTNNSFTFRMIKQDRIYIENTFIKEPLFMFGYQWDQKIDNPSTANGVIVFNAGVHNIGEKSYGSGKTIILKPGAIVRGRIGVGNHSKIYGRGTITWKTSPTTIAGHGGKNGFDRRCVEMGGNSELMGVTIFDPQAFCIGVGSGSKVQIQQTNLFSWGNNGDGFGAGANSTISNSFSKCSDDHMKLYYNGKTFSDIVIYQEKNGAVIQLGWMGEGTSRNIKNCTVKDIYVVKSLAKGDNWPGNGKPNNGIISWASGGSVTYTNLLIENVVVEGSCFRVVSNNMLNADMVNSKVNNFSVGSQISKSLIHANASGPNFDLDFNNLKIGNTKVTNINKGKFFGFSNVTSGNNADVSFSTSNTNPCSGNTAPVVSFSTPSNGSSFSVGDDISVTVAASDNDGSISNVKLYLDNTLVREEKESPYQWGATGQNDLALQNMAAGNYTLRAVAQDNCGATKTQSITVVIKPLEPVQSPYNDILAAIPGTIKAAEYDLGGEGVAFHDSDSVNEGKIFRTDGVDIEISSEGNYNVGWTKAGEWLEYTVNVASTGLYKLDARVAAITADNAFRVEFDSQNVSGSITVPNTGGWQTWQTVSVNDIALTAGTHIMRVYMKSGGFNINSITFSEIAADCIPEINFPGGRVALSFDGNQHDPDDIGALPLSLAFWWAAGLKNKVVHVEHSNHVCDNNTSMHNKMKASAEGVINRFGYSPSIIFDYQSQSNQSSTHLAKMINNSSASDPLWIIAAGPMETIWRGMNKAKADKRKFVTIISHSKWNQNHGDCNGSNRKWSNLRNNFPTAFYVESGTNLNNANQLPDQNNSNGNNDFNTPNNKWFWLRDSNDENLAWLYTRDQFNNKFDPSDAGMSYFLITGGPHSNGNKKAGWREAKKLLEKPCNSDTNSVCNYYEERNGLVIMEAEHTKSDLNLWKEKKNVNNYTGKGHLEFTGNGSNGGPAKSPLKYTFKVNKAGEYRLFIRARKRLDGQPSDKNNDGYLMMEGEFTAGANAGNNHNDDAPLSSLKQNTKFFGGNANNWGWAKQLDLGGHNNKRNAVYNFKAGKTYTLTISGRSINWNIDRIVLRHTSVNDVEAQKPSYPETRCNNVLPVNAETQEHYTDRKFNRPILQSLYPNPSSDFIQIKLIDHALVKIISISGETLFQDNMSEGIQSISLENIPLGIHILKTISNKGVEYSKFVKK